MYLYLLFFLIHYSTVLHSSSLVVELVPHLLKTNLREKRGMVIVLPGGGYSSLADHEANTWEWVNQIGLHAAVLYYRIGRPWPEPLEDARRAVQLVRRNAEEWGVDPRKVGVLGFSAGGHLAAMLATTWASDDFGLMTADALRSASGDVIARQSARPDFAILAYPGIRVPWRVLPVGRHLSEEQVELLNPDLQVTSATPPCFAWATEDDNLCPARTTRLFMQALKAAGVRNSKFVAYPYGPHGLGLAQDPWNVCLDWTQQCEEWLSVQGWLAVVASSSARGRGRRGGRGSGRGRR